MGIDNQGLEGLELYYDRYLRGGKPGAAVFERDAHGRALEEGGVRGGYLPGDKGDDLVLTLDFFVQRMAEEEVRRATSETGSRLGLIVITEPRTGEILANAIYPTFEIDNFSDYPPVENRRNVAVTDTYEPGSTFKAVTAAIALNEGGVASLRSGFFLIPATFGSRAGRSAAGTGWARLTVFCGDDAELMQPLLLQVGH